mmetsp:Transcript_47783/g.116309  ORF Transcript_47783/g.116309 Transcript_47783/m.116309 type:complete len:199 (+) Transcript_47783:81-677(+)|eukprot:CAMPEP_0113452888 /NCGR_PEP_ID=MMETSP0014_2-20120614/7076_1 /TAXON_ID=2857 /ORGANISM="Nitzschia sp." /LENGTH=198 /DNA_ID=CAMNT_0000344269 /DNA_START=87 /DNA_END=683 /DNA_ORIENTATION=- /assembly_acc=CAM_ASM_000159
MKAVIAASLLATASAFSTSQAPGSRSMTQLSAGMDDMVGSIDFRVKEFKFDPLKLSETYEPLLPWFRESEIRHGRTAMLAVLGFITTDFIRIPGEMYSFESIPKTVDAHNILVEKGPMVQLLMWIGLFDLIITAPACAATMKGEREPGDFGWYTFAPETEEGLKAKQESELLNGRLAMCAIGGIATQSITTGHGFPYL